MVRVCRRMPLSLRPASPLVRRVIFPIMRISIPALARSSKAGHGPVGNLHVVNEQLFFGALKMHGFFSRIQRANQKSAIARNIALSFGVAFEDLDCFLDQRAVGGHDAEAAAMVDIRPVRLRPGGRLLSVDDHHLAVERTRSLEVRATVMPAQKTVSSLRRFFSPPRFYKR